MALVTLNNSLLTLAESKTSLTLTGQESLVDRLVELDNIASVARAEIDVGRMVLDAEVTNLRINAEKSGSFAKKVVAIGTKNVLPYEFKNSFMNLGSLSLSTLSSKLGPSLVKTLFTTKKKITLRKGRSLEEVVAKLGETAKEFFDIEEVVTPVEKFLEQRFILRGQLDEPSNESIDEVVSSISQKPSLSFK